MKALRYRVSKKSFRRRAPECGEAAVGADVSVDLFFDSFTWVYLVCSGDDDSSREHYVLLWLMTQLAVSHSISFCAGYPVTFIGGDPP